MAFKNPRVWVFGVVQNVSGVDVLKVLKEELEQATGRLRLKNYQIAVLVCSDWDYMFGVRVSRVQDIEGIDYSDNKSYKNKFQEALRELPITTNTLNNPKSIAKKCWLTRLIVFKLIETAGKCSKSIIPILKRIEDQAPKEFFFKLFPTTVFVPESITEIFNDRSSKVKTRGINFLEYVSTLSNENASKLLVSYSIEKTLGYQTVSIVAGLSPLFPGSDSSNVNHYVVNIENDQRAYDEVPYALSELMERVSSNKKFISGVLLQALEFSVHMSEGESRTVAGVSLSKKKYQLGMIRLAKAGLELGFRTT